MEAGEAKGKEDWKAPYYIENESENTCEKNNVGELTTGHHQDADEEIYTATAVETELDTKFKTPALPADGPPEAATAADENGSELVKGAAAAPERRKLADTLCYKEPSWAKVPGSEHSFEVVKEGVMLSEIPLLGTTETFRLVGRQDGCHIQLEHPSISRIHAIVQFGDSGIEEGQGRKTGWYIYDLGSTHGTTLNKVPVPIRAYIRLRVGHILRFGGSTRLFILRGPEDDKEPESSASVTELIRRAEKRKLQMEKVSEPVPKSKRTPEPNQESQTPASSGISWGLEYDLAKEEEEGEGEEGEEIDFDTLQQREEFYRDDPRKALKHFFDKSGYEMEFEFEEKGSGFKHQWICRIELPVESKSGKPLVAEVVASGSKKEAQVQCCMEACRTLDAHNVLRSGVQSESRRRQVEELSANDFYDSDEDTFLDRTGELEKKRQRRIQRIKGGPTSNKAETYQSLCEKLETVKAQMKRVEEELDKMTATETRVRQGEAADPLDAYMAKVRKEDSLGAEGQESKMQKSKLRLQLVDLKKQADRLEKLAKVAKPAALPALRPPEKLHGDETRMRKAPVVWIGSMKGHRLRKAPQTELPPEPAPVLPGNNASDVEIEDEEEEDAGPIVDSEHFKKYTVELPPSAAEEDSATPTKAQSDAAKVSGEQPPSARSRRPRHRNRQAPLTEDYDATDPNYSFWLPPDTQKGDGHTSLNEKYGY